MGKRRVSGIYVEVAALTKGLEGGLIRAEQLCKRSSLQMDKTMQKVKFGGVISSVQQLDKSFGALRGTLAGLSIGIFAKSVFDAGVQAEKLGLAFKSITGSSAAADDELSFLRSTASKLGGEFYSLAEAYKGIAGAAKGTALEGVGVRNVFSSIMEAGVALGASNDQLSRTFLQIGQGIGRTRFELEDLKTIAEALPGVGMGDFAKSIGVTTQEFFKMVTAGKVVAEDFLPKLASSLHDKFGAAAAEASNSAQGAVNRFTTSWKDLMAEIAQSGALDAMVDGLREITDYIKENNAAITRIAEDIIYFGRIVGKLVGIIADAFSVVVVNWNILSEKIKEFIAYLKNLADISGVTNVAIKAIGAVVEEVGRFFGASTKEINAFNKAIGEIADVGAATKNITDKHSAAEIFGEESRALEGYKTQLKEAKKSLEELLSTGFQESNGFSFLGNEKQVREVEGQIEALNNKIAATRVRVDEAKKALLGFSKEGKSLEEKNPFESLQTDSADFIENVKDAQAATEKFYKLIDSSSEMSINHQIDQRKKEIEEVIKSGIPLSTQQTKAMYDELDAYSKKLWDDKHKRELAQAQEYFKSVGDLIDESNQSSIADHEKEIDEYRRNIEGYYSLIDDLSDESIDYQIEQHKKMIETMLQSSKALADMGIGGGLSIEQEQNLWKQHQKFIEDISKNASDRRIEAWKKEKLASDDFFSGIKVGMSEIGKDSKTASDIAYGAFKDMYASIEYGFQDVFKGLFEGQIDGFEDMANRMKDIFVSMLAEMAAKAAMEKLTPSDEALSGALPMVGALGLGTVGASGAETSLGLDKGSISKLPVGAGAIAASFFATDVALQKLFGKNESKFTFTDREIGFNEKVNATPLSKPNEVNQTVIDAITSMQEQLWLQMDDIASEIPGAYSKKLTEDLAGLSISLGGWTETKNEDFQKDVEARISEMSDSIQNQVEPILLSVLDSMKTDFTSQYGDFAGTSGIDKAFTSGGLSAASTVVSDIKSAIDTLQLAIDPEQAETLAYQIDQVNRQYAEQKDQAEKLGISIDLVSQAEEAATDRVKKAFADQKKAMEDALQLSIDPAMADTLQYQIDQINQKYDEQVKQAELLGVSLSMVSDARNSEIEALKSAEDERQRIEAEKVETARLAAIEAERQLAAQEILNRSSISDLLDDVAFSVDDLAGYVTDAMRATKQANDQFDDYASQLASLGATAEDLLQLEALRAEYLKAQTGSLRDAAGIQDIFSGIDYQINSVSGAMSDLDQSIYQINQSFSAYSSQLKQMGATAAELELLESKRVKTIDAERAAIERANQESEYRSYLAKLESETSQMSSLKDSMLSYIQDKERSDWGMSEYQEELGRLNDEMASLNENSADYSIELIDVATRQFSVLQNIDRLQLEQKQALDDLVKSAASLIDNLTDLRKDYLTSDYAPSQSMEAYQQRYDDYMSRVADPNLPGPERIDAGEEFADFLPEFLSFMQGTSSDYANIFDKAMDDLGKVQIAVASGAIDAGGGSDLVDQIMPDLSGFAAAIEDFSWDDYLSDVTWGNFIERLDKRDWDLIISSPDWASFEASLPDLEELMNVGKPTVDKDNYFFETLNWQDVLPALSEDDLKSALGLDEIAQALPDLMSYLNPDNYFFSGTELSDIIPAISQDDWEKIIVSPDWKKFEEMFPDASKIFESADGMQPILDWDKYITKIEGEGGSLTWHSFLENVTQDDWEKLISSPEWEDLKPILPDWSGLSANMPDLSGLDFSDFKSPDWLEIIDTIKKSGGDYSWSDFISDLTDDQWKTLITSPEWSKYLEANGLDAGTFTAILDAMRNTDINTSATAEGVGGKTGDTSAVDLLREVILALDKSINENTFSQDMAAVVGKVETGGATQASAPGIISQADEILSKNNADGSAIWDALNSIQSKYQQGYNSDTGMYPGAGFEASSRIGSSDYYLHGQHGEGSLWDFAISNASSFTWPQKEETPVGTGNLPSSFDALDDLTSLNPNTIQVGDISSLEDIKAMLKADTQYQDYVKAIKAIDYWGDRREADTLLAANAINGFNDYMESGNGTLAGFSDQNGASHSVWLDGDKLQYYASGGYSDKPAIFGDAGAEWAVPAFDNPNNLNFLRSVGIESLLAKVDPEKIADAVANRASNQRENQQITVTVPVILDGREIGRAFSRQIDTQPELKRQLTRL